MANEISWAGSEELVMKSLEAQWVPLKDLRSAGGAEEPDGWGPLGPEPWGPGGCTMYILRSLLQRCLGCSY